MATTLGGYVINASFVRRAKRKYKQYERLKKLYKAGVLDERRIKKLVNLSNWFHTVYRPDLRTPPLPSPEERERR